MTPRSAARVSPNALHARKQDVVRAAIWDAAVALFAESGFEATTVEQVAAAAGVSTRTFFRYFASKNDLMGQSMAAYRSLLGEAIQAAPEPLTAARLLRYTVARVAAEAAAYPRMRQLVNMARTSPAAREAQLSRRGEVENAVAQAFAAKCRTAPGDEVTPRLLAGLTLSILDVTFRVWSSRSAAEITAVGEEVCDALTSLLQDAGPATRARVRQPKNRIAR
jgi:AcrR family transcriptional regulator